MQCPSCAHAESRVIDSRPVERNTAIRRRRVCEQCSHRYTTYERVVSVVCVTKRDGRVEPFDASKLRRGIESALADRPVPAGSVDSLVEAVEQRAAAESRPLSTEDVGTMVLDRLRSIDEIASLRFASVYKDFKEVEDFERELAELEASVNTAE